MSTEQAHVFVDQLAKTLELVGVAIILGGIFFATVTFVRDGARARGWRSAYPRYRSDIGRGILLGLELLVGADIISTITAPLTFESVGLLAGIVAIRTFLSFPLKPKSRVAGPGSGPPKMPLSRPMMASSRPVPMAATEIACSGGLCFGSRRMSPVGAAQSVRSACL